jgi:hypothetical protein
MAVGDDDDKDDSKQKNVEEYTGEAFDTFFLAVTKQNSIFFGFGRRIVLTKMSKILKSMEFVIFQYSKY